jgi:hypothetical protein
MSSRRLTCEHCSRVKIVCRYLSGIAGNWIPIRVTASGSTGTATDLGCVSGTEDTISLLVDWESGDDPSKRGMAVYTASWTAPNGGEFASGLLSIPAELRVPWSSLQLESTLSNTFTIWDRRVRCASIRLEGASTFATMEKGQRM